MPRPRVDTPPIRGRILAALKMAHEPMTRNALALTLRLNSPAALTTHLAALVAEGLVERRLHWFSHTDVNGRWCGEYRALAYTLSRSTTP